VRLAIVTGICVEHDAISAAVVEQAEMASSIPGVETVDVFTQHLDRKVGCGVHLAGNPWELLTHEVFGRADVAIFHFGIRYSIFDAIIGLDPQRTRAVVHFHNITPVDLVAEADRPAAEQSYRQVMAAQVAEADYWYYSEFNRRTLIGWGIDPSKMSFVPFPIESPRPLRPRAGGRGDGTLSLVSVGRFTPAKGTHVILEALAEVRSKIDHPIELKLIGNLSLSDPRYIEELEDMLDTYELHDMVTFVADADDDDVWRCYENADVVVSASLHEGLCVPIIEGYLAGCRAIGTTVGNLPFVVQSPDPLVRPGDPEALAAAIMAVDAEVRSGFTRRRDAARDLCMLHSKESSLKSMCVALDDRLNSGGIR